jgi:hypothetical protein
LDPDSLERTRVGTLGQGKFAGMRLVSEYGSDWRVVRDDGTVLSGDEDSEDTPISVSDKDES